MNCLNHWGWGATFPRNTIGGCLGFLAFGASVVLCAPCLAQSSGNSFVAGTTAITVDAGAGTSSVLIAANPAGAPWTAQAGSSWLHVTNGQGSGSQLVVFGYDSNPVPTPRSGTLNISGQVVTVTQAGNGFAPVSPGTLLISDPTGPVTGVAADAQGRIYAAFGASNSVLMWNPATGQSASLPITGLKSPGALATDAQGNLYIVDAGNGAIKKWDGKSVVSLVSGLVSPAGVAVGARGIIYFVDSSLGNIQFLDPATGNLSVLAKNLPGIKSIAVDFRGNLYIVDPVQGAIVTGDPSVTTIQPVTLATGISKTAVLTVDGQGNIYISDSSAVQRFSAAGQGLTSVAVAPNDAPAQMAVDPQGNLYRAGAALEQIAFGYVGPVNVAVTSAQGTGSVQVIPPSIPVSPPTASQPWLSIAPPANGTVNFSFSSNSTAASRSATFTVLGQPVTVTQAGFVDIQSVTKIGDGQIVATGVAFASLQVRLADGANSAIPDVALTFLAPANSDGVATAIFATGASATVTTDASGVATAPKLTANGIPGTFTVTVTGPNGPLTSFTLSSIGPVPTSLSPSPVTVQQSLPGTAIAVTFSAITKAGTTSIVPSSQGIPTGYFLASGTSEFDIQTTAVFTGPVTVCFTLPTVTDQTVFQTLRVLHFPPSAGWTDETILTGTNAPNFAAKQICAQSTSLSPFAVVIPGNIPIWSLQLKHAGSFIQGQDGTLTLTLTNTGNATSNGAITIADSVPAGLQLIAVLASSTSLWSCNLAQASCVTTAALSPNQSATVGLSVHVLAGAAASQTNSATVTGGGALYEGASDTIAIQATTAPISLQRALPAGTAPVALVSADFNGDSFPDLAFADSGANAVSILFGAADGSFGTATTYPTGRNPTALVATDFNMDGVPDLAVANNLSGDITILLGTATGSLTPVAGSIPAGTLPRGIVSADFNGDGLPDLAVANSGSNDVTILLGDGAGGFQKAASLPAGASPSSLVTGDFNGDGKIDLAVADSGGDGVTILLGDGTGNFSPGIRFSAGSGPSSITTADFNGDGRLDLALANADSNDITILLGDGKGGFAPAAGSPIPVGTHPSAIAANDLNGDGVTDLAIANFGSNDVFVLFGDGKGGFSFNTNGRAAANSLPLAIAVADFNADGMPDVAVACSSGSILEFLGTLPRLSVSPVHLDVNAVAGARVPPAISLTLQPVSQAGTPPQINITSSQPWLTASLYPGTAQLYFNTSNLPPGRYRGVIRFEAPGYLAASNQVSLHVVAPSGTLSLSTSPLPAGESPRGIATADFNGDGIPDLAILNFGSNDISILLGVGGRQFSAAPTIKVPSQTGPVAIVQADFNGDGKADLAGAFANGGSSSVVILLGDGKGNFKVIGNPSNIGDRLSTLSVGDFNGDGIPDLIATLEGGPKVVLLTGSGGGGFHSMAFDTGLNVAFLPRRISMAMAKRTW